jgi:hypothetical protein
MRTKSEQSDRRPRRPFEEESLPRRRRPRIQTARQLAVAACAAHLRDLRRVHRAPPADVALRSVAIPARLHGPDVASFCVSPAALCAELAR